MNAADLLAAGRLLGADFGLDPAKPRRILVRGEALIPDALRQSIRAQHRSVVAALEAEQVARSTLDWRRHGPHWLTLVDAGDGQARLLVTPDRRRRTWSLSARWPGGHPTVMLAHASLAGVLAVAERAADPSAVKVAS